jgi:hypothetical protein
MQRIRLQGIRLCVYPVGLASEIKIGEGSPTGVVELREYNFRTIALYFSGTCPKGGIIFIQVCLDVLGALILSPYSFPQSLQPGTPHRELHRPKNKYFKKQWGVVPCRN